MRRQARLSDESSISPTGLAQVPGQSEAGRGWHWLYPTDVQGFPAEHGCLCGQIWSGVAAQYVGWLMHSWAECKEHWRLKRFYIKLSKYERRQTLCWIDFLDLVQVWVFFSRYLLQKSYRWGMSPPWWLGQTDACRNLLLLPYCTFIAQVKAIPML